MLLLQREATLQLRHLLLKLLRVFLLVAGGSLAQLGVGGLELCLDLVELLFGLEQVASRVLGDHAHAAQLVLALLGDCLELGLVRALVDFNLGLELLHLLPCCNKLILHALVLGGIHLVAKALEELIVPLAVKIRLRFERVASGLECGELRVEFPFERLRGLELLPQVLDLLLRCFKVFSALLLVRNQHLVHVAEQGVLRHCSEEVLVLLNGEHLGRAALGDAVHFALELLLGSCCLIGGALRLLLGPSKLQFEVLLLENHDVALALRDLQKLAKTYSLSHRVGRDIGLHLGSLLLRRAVNRDLEELLLHVANLRVEPVGLLSEQLVLAGELRQLGAEGLVKVRESGFLLGPSLLARAQS
mmetsp:Transcript_2346/g.7181  ORF Transcript_2346/g.7181 Transcript_2346/m.7181 type:complete len:360 (-) Transcript_2346:8-1087(-)